MERVEGVKTSTKKRKTPSGPNSGIESPQKKKFGHANALCSYQDRLRVPLAVVFLEHNKKPLLTKSEAHIFLEVRALAHRLDTLVNLVERALEPQVSLDGWNQDLQRVNEPYLRPLASLIHFHQQTLPNLVLERTNGQLQDIQTDLQHCQHFLRQYSEQNWTLAETLQDAGPFGLKLADKKRILSDIQEEIARRIETMHEEGTTTTQLSMQDYCRQKLRLPESTGNVDRNQDTNTIDPTAKDLPASDSDKNRPPPEQPTNQSTVNLDQPMRYQFLSPGEDDDDESIEDPMDAVTPIQKLATPASAAKMHNPSSAFRPRLLPDEKENAPSQGTAASSQTTKADDDHCSAGSTQEAIEVLRDMKKPAAATKE